MRSRNKKKYILRELFQAAVILLAIYIGFPIWLKSGKVIVYDNQSVRVYADKNANTKDINSIVNTCMELLDEHDIESGRKLSFVFYPTREEYAKKNLFISKTSLASNWGIFNLITFAPVDFSVDRQYAKNDCLNQRPVSSVMAHEIVHTHQIENLGVIKYGVNRTVAKWKIEGQAEYVSESSSLPYPKGMELFLLGDKDNYLENNGLKTEYFYFLSHLKVDYLLGHMNTPEESFWKIDYNEENLENEIKEAIKTGEYAGLI